jgi:shikimate kinase
MLTHLKKPLIYLTGFMGSGKSAVGAELARSLCLNFSDLDLLILLLDIRQPSYEEAELFIDTSLKTIEQIVNEIIFELEKGNWL